MIPYKISFWRNAQSDFLKLPKEIQERIAGKLKIAQSDPFQFFFRLKGRPDYKLRIGEYRVIADVRRNERAIEITKVGHRRNIYK